MEPGLQIYLLVAIPSALLGALITPLVYWAKGRKPSSGFFAGGLLGGLGSLVLLVPLWFLLRPRQRLDQETFDTAVAYNLGVAAALGERREEARYYFAQVTQADPHNIAAWLYLANLATTPLEAWSYVQQARAADASHPMVTQAVAVVWPQVQRQYNESSTPAEPGA